MGRRTRGPLVRGVRGEASPFSRARGATDRGGDPTPAFEALAAEFPLAAAFVRAEEFEGSQAPEKFHAGVRAKAILTAGGELAEAFRELDSWGKSIDALSV